MVCSPALYELGVCRNSVYEIFPQSELSVPGGLLERRGIVESIILRSDSDVFRA